MGWGSGPVPSVVMVRPGEAVVGLCEGLIHSPRSHALCDLARTPSLKADLCGWGLTPSGLALPGDACVWGLDLGVRAGRPFFRPEDTGHVAGGSLARPGHGSADPLGSCRGPCGHPGGSGLHSPVGGCCLGLGSLGVPGLCPWALNPRPPGGRGPREGLPGRQQHVPLIWTPQQLVGCGAPPACLVPPVTNSPTPGGLASHMVSALCPFSAPPGGEEGNKTELLGELQRYTLVIKRSFRVSH